MVADVDLGRGPEVIKQLQEYLRVGDIQATQLAREEAPLLQALLGGTHADKLLRHILAFDYEQASGTSAERKAEERMTLSAFTCRRSRGQSARKLR